MQKQEYNRLIFWIEEYLFYPNFIQRILSFLLLPLSFVYCVIVVSKRKFTKSKDPGIPIISIGNLTVGGNGKTPFTISLAKNKKNIAIILRGYKRDSENLLVVSDFGDIKCDVKDCGDEAMLYAKSLPNALTIVSKDRIKAINFAKKRGVKAIFLDDAFHRSEIKKFDILLEPKKEYHNSFCLPSGPYREPKKLYQKANIVAKEGKDFTREVILQNPTKKMLLITAISKPERLDEFLPKDDTIIAKIYFQDHHSYTLEEIEHLIKTYKPTSILTTKKDEVKLEKFDLNLSILDLDIKIDKSIIDKVDDFIDNFGKF